MLRLGDGLELRLGTAARRCRYRLSVGGVFHDLLVVQEAGARSAAALRSTQGTSRRLWEAAPQRLEPRPGYEQAPGVLPLSQVHHLRLRNPQDAFGNAIAAGTVLQPAAQNAWANPELPVLRAADGGTALEFSVAGGATLGEDAIIRASSAMGWQQPPELRFVAQQQAPQVQRISVTGVDRKTYRSNGGSANITPADGRAAATKTAPP